MTYDPLRDDLRTLIAQWEDDATRYGNTTVASCARQLRDVLREPAGNPMLSEGEYVGADGRIKRREPAGNKCDCHITCRVDAKGAFFHRVDCSVGATLKLDTEKEPRS